jgi:quinol monooxygenase YgiN
MKRKKSASTLLLAVIPVTFPLTVLVRYKALPGGEETALRELKVLIAKVSGEPHYIDIALHVDPADRSNILLIERWSDAGYYTGAHMQTPHLQEFIKASRAFLAGPPDISFWNREPE